MKKLLYAIVVPAAIMFSSCLGSSETQTSEVQPGVEIYNSVRPQVDMDLDPMILALKLNTLIVTAEEEGEAYSSVTVTIGEGDDKEEIGVMKRLFGQGNEVTRSGNEWVLEFKTGTRDDKEKYARRGEVTVNTYGHTLEDLLEDPALRWEVAVPDDGYEIIHTTGDRYVSKMTTYTISASTDEDATWAVRGHSAAYHAAASQYAANWNFVYEVTFPGVLSFYFPDTMNSTFMLSGQGEGVPAGWDSRFTYTAVDLKYKPRCYLWYIFGGTEYVEGSRSSFDSERYPETLVRYGWFDYSSSSPCQNSVIISYNGYSITS